MTAVLSDQPLTWDPFDSSYKANPYPIWRRLRDEAPVYHNEQYDFWVLSRYADVSKASLDAKTFSSSHGTVIETMTEEPMTGQLMIFMDQPQHTVFRRLVSRAFTMRRVSELESGVRQLCAGLLDELRDRGQFDYVADFGALVPANVIALLLGVPEQDRTEVRETIDAIFHIEPDKGMANDVAFAAMAKLNGYIQSQLEERTKRPRADMLSDLLMAEVTEEDGNHRKLTLEECTTFGVMLVAAGTETVARLLGWAGVTLAQHPAQRAELSSDYSLIPNAIEELLRYEAPSPVNGRWTTDEVHLHDGSIPPGSKVVLLTGSAGRDDRVFSDADSFDIHRAIDQHVSFGAGIHFCLGAALARLEGRVALEETLTRFPEWDIDLAKSEFLFTSTVRGYSRLPISVTG